MSDEMKNEILKAHIYGLSNIDIAIANGITVEEVEEVLSDTTAVTQKRNFLKESGWIE